MEDKKKKTLDVALIICMLTALIFTVAMVVIFCIYQATPDVLIGAVFAALFGELGFCTLIQKEKMRKKGEEDEYIN